MINNFSLNNRILYFLAGCIVVRTLFVVVLKYTPKQYLPYLGALLLAQSFGFLYLYFGNLRLSAPESGGNTWWSHLRLIHGLLYLAAGIYAIQQKDIAWVPLLIDVIFGLVAFLSHHHMLQL
jgi:hypothetical protein